MSSFITRDRILPKVPPELFQSKIFLLVWIINKKMLTVMLSLLMKINREVENFEYNVLLSVSECAHRSAQNRCQIFAQKEYMHL